MTPVEVLKFSPVGRAAQPQNMLIKKDIATNTGISIKKKALGSTKADALDGVTVADLEPQVRSQLRVPANVHGALVAEVDPASNSAEAGLRPNDLIVEINRQPVSNSEDAVRLGKAARGEQILVKIWRRLGDFGGTRYLSVNNTKHAK